MSDTVIRVETLSKMYHIGRIRQRHDTLRDAIVAAFRRPKAQAGQDPADTIWALKDVSFEVQRGEVIGIIGRNGAGKSTLLKILSRITEPTHGWAEIQGRVGSLLEVGTGFHPELTGRENVYLNGAILGMRRTEIDRKFDAIVDFAEIEQFLDTPVKRYSSGMYVRLAFSVAAYLETEVLLVDEVLAVGDARFQRKCLGLIGDITQGGRTALFVSHNMSAVRRLCTQTLMLGGGQLLEFGRTQDVVNHYTLAEASAAAPRNRIDLKGLSRRGTQQAYFSELAFYSPNADLLYQPYTDGPLHLTLGVESDQARTVGSFAVTIYDQYYTKLVNVDTLSLGQEVTLEEGRNIIDVTIEELHLNEGFYTLGLWMANPTGGVLDHLQTVIQFKVITPELTGFGVRPASDGVVSCRFSVRSADAREEPQLFESCVDGITTSA